MKQCKRCKEILPLSSFHVSRGHRDGHKWSCKACENARERERLKQKPRKKLLTPNQAWLVMYKQTLSCQQCGESHPACLDFHHVDPDEKTEHISRMVKFKRYSHEDLLAELEKCIVLCSNCHRKEHYSEAQYKLALSMLEQESE